MWQYIVLIMVPIAIQHITIGKNNISDDLYIKKNDISFKFFWSLLLILLILRSESVGVDLTVYKRIFEIISESSWIKGLERSPEVAWTVLNQIVIFFGGGFRWIIAVSSVMSVIFISKAYIKYSNDAALTIALFITISNFVLLFSGLRQSIAISLGVLAFEFTSKKKLVPFIITVVFAMMFHTSAFMIAFIYPAYYIKIKKKHLLFIIPGLACVWIFNQQIFSFLGLILEQFTDYDTDITKTGSITMLILFIIFAVFSYVIPEESKMDADTIGMRNLLILVVIIQMFAPLHSIAMRMGYYYMIFIPILLPRIIRLRSLQMSQVAIIARHIMVIFFIIYFFVTAPADNVLQTFPYKFFWERM